jgi:3-hydroxyisobutyrate dehydrogenase-like beta-hydroxyacid dehydrogenase
MSACEAITVGVIGLGSMGLGMAQSVVNRAIPVRI